MAKVGIICGMASEVVTLGEFARHPEISVTVSGARPDRAGDLADHLVTDGARLLVSWGIAGGLDPALATGALIVPDRVVMPDRVELPLASELLDHPSGGALAGSDEVVTSAEAKAALRARTGAIAVDMETHRVAAVAAERRIPCLAVRAISDPAGRALPSLAASALSEDGHPMIVRVLLGLAGRPWELPDLIRAGRDSNKAHAGLTDMAGRVFQQLLDGAAN